MTEVVDTDYSYAEDDELVAQFLEWTDTAVKDMRGILDGMPDKAGPKEASVQQVYDLTHNIKGMGSSFEFNLLTNVGASLCKYLKQMPDDQLASKRVLEGHVRTFEVVLQHKIKGSGGAQGEAILQRLENIIDEEASA